MERTGCIQQTISQPYIRQRLRLRITQTIFQQSVVIAINTDFYNYGEMMEIIYPQLKACRLAEAIIITHIQSIYSLIKKAR